MKTSPLALWIGLPLAFITCTPLLSFKRTRPQGVLVPGLLPYWFRAFCEILIIIKYTCVPCILNWKPSLRFDRTQLGLQSCVSMRCMNMTLMCITYVRNYLFLVRRVARALWCVIPVMFMHGDTTLYWNPNSWKPSHLMIIKGGSAINCSTLAYVMYDNDVIIGGF